MPKYRVEIRVEADDIDSIPDVLNKIDTTNLENLMKIITIYNEDTNLTEDLSKIL